MRFCLTLFILTAALPGFGQAKLPLRYHGGPILTSFRVVPIYYGNWTTDDVALNDTYLKNLANYISGRNAPPNQQPAIRQYGVISMTVAPHAVTNPDATTVPSADVIVKVIHDNQMSGNVPQYDGRTLIVLFLAPAIPSCGGYHSAESPTKFWAIAGTNCRPWDGLTAHEIFEAAADPADLGIDKGNAWDETVDFCDGIVLEPNGVAGFRITGISDNTLDGWCSTTGYTPMSPPRQRYGFLLNDLKNPAAGATTKAAYQFSSVMQPNNINRKSPGVYEVILGGLVPGGDDSDDPQGPIGGTVLVNAYGTGTETCQLGAWRQGRKSDPDPHFKAWYQLYLNVHCFDSSGSPADSQFTMSYTAWTMFSDLTYLFANNDSSASYQPNLTLTFDGYSTVAPTITRSAAGAYEIHLPGVVQNSGVDPHGGGIVVTTAYGTDNAYCKPKAWKADGNDLVAQVLCFAPSGNPADSRFTMSYVHKTDVLGRFSSNHAHVWANEPTAPTYTPDAFYQSNTQIGDITITRSGTGSYAVLIPQQADSGGHVTVNAYGSGNERCNVGKWHAASADELVDVHCFAPSGAPADSRFVLAWVASGS